MTTPLGPETRIHGKAWASMHGGYFSSVKKATPLVSALRKTALRTRPAVLADLGGGTGFILSQFRKSPSCRKIRLLNVDVSSKQLGQCGHPEITRVHSTVTDLRRDALMRDHDGRLMLTMRSLLHYSGGRAQWKSFLRHLRGLCKPGEYLIHQSACFETRQDADLMSDIYRLMHTNKRFPTISELAKLLEDTGWKIEQQYPAPTIFFTAVEMKDRYRFSNKNLAAIAKTIAKAKGCSAAFNSADGFTGSLEYRIFVCKAK